MELTIGQSISFHYIDFSLHRRVPLLRKGQWCIRKMAASVTLGINTDGKKKVLTISVGDNESAKYRFLL